MIDVENMKLEELLAMAVRAEMDARETYAGIAEKVDNFVLKDRLKFLSAEEEKHRQIFTGILKRKFPNSEVRIPESGEVPLPDVKFDDEMVQISEVLQQAMDAEMAAHDFYAAMRDKAQDEEVKKILDYLSSAEKGHYYLLETELKAVKYAELFDEYNPMMHVGP